MKIIQWLIALAGGFGLLVAVPFYAITSENTDRLVGLLLMMLAAAVWGMAVAHCSKDYEQWKRGA